MKRNASSGPEEEPSRGAGERGEGRRETKPGRKGRWGERKRRRRIKTQEKKVVGAKKKKKIIKSGKKKIKLKTNLMDITEAEFPPEVQNMRALE